MGLGAYFGKLDDLHRDSLGHDHPPFFGPVNEPDSPLELFSDLSREAWLPEGHLFGGETTSIMGRVSERL